MSYISDMIERFRSEPPKSREERLNERGPTKDSPQMWWDENPKHSKPKHHMRQIKESKDSQKPRGRSRDVAKTASIIDKEIEKLSSFDENQNSNLPILKESLEKPYQSKFRFADSQGMMFGSMGNTLDSLDDIDLDYYVQRRPEEVNRRMFESSVESLGGRSEVKYDQTTNMMTKNGFGDNDDQDIPVEVYEEILRGLSTTKHDKEGNSLPYKFSKLSTSLKGRDGEMVDHEMKVEMEGVGEDGTRDDDMRVLEEISHNLNGVMAKLTEG